MSLISSVQAQQGAKPGQRQVTPTGGVKSSSRADIPAKKPDEGTAKGGKADVAVDPEQERRAKAAEKALDAVLAKWEIESSKIKSLHGLQRKSEYNHVFRVEKVSEGPFFFETPDRGRIDFLSVKIPKGKVSEKKDPTTGKPFELTSGQSERWICNGTQIIEIMEDEKTYTSIEIPEEKRGKNIIHTPLPFLFGMKADEAKSRFDLKLKSENEKEAVLLARPKMAQDQQNYRAAQITLNKKNHYLPEEVRLVDQEQHEIRYRFEKAVINDGDFKGTMSALFGMKGDPFNPSLKGYQVMVPPEDPIAEREKKQQAIQQLRGVDSNPNPRTNQGNGQKSDATNRPQSATRNSLTPTTPRK